MRTGRQAGPARGIVYGARREIEQLAAGRVGGCGAMIGTMGSAFGAGAVADGAAGRGAGGMVARPRLFGRLGAGGRVSVVSAPPGRGQTAAPDLDGWVITERLLADLAPLDEALWLVVDDVHELGGDALAQLELLIMRAPPDLRFVLAARHDVRLGLHRLRLEGELAEVREP